MYKLFHHFGLCHDYLLLSRQPPSYPDFQSINSMPNLVNCLIKRRKYQIGSISEGSPLPVWNTLYTQEFTTSDVPKNFPRTVDFPIL